MVKMAQFIAEDCSTTADVSSSIFKPDIVEDDSTAVFIDDIIEDNVFDDDEDKSAVITAVKSHQVEHQQLRQQPLDPLAQSYKSVINLINQTSQGFREGKKWKCNSSCSPQQRRRQVNPPTVAAAAAEQTCRCKRRCSQCDNSSSFDQQQQLITEPNMASGKRQQLVRQMACTEYFDETEIKRFNVNGRMPSRQWTTDNCQDNNCPEDVSLLAKSKATSSPMVMSANSNAFLLRPVSRNSRNNDQEVNPKSPATKAAIAAAMAAQGIANGQRAKYSSAASDHRISMNSLGPEIRSAPNGTLLQHQRLLRKQRTTESAPTAHFLMGMSGGVTIRQLPRQHSNASAYSMAIPSTYSHQGITLVRGASCSLVDIPTYLGPALHPPGGGVVDVQGKSGKIEPQIRPRLQLDLTKKTNHNAKASTKKTKWTILCVGLTLLTMCVTLVGTMLSIGSQYQEMVMARKWENEMVNTNYSQTSFRSDQQLTLLFTKSLKSAVVDVSTTKAPRINMESYGANEEEEDPDENEIDMAKGYRTALD